MIAKIALFTLFLVGANCFYINQECNRLIALEDLEDLYSEQPLEYVQAVFVMERRQVQGVVNTNPDGTINIMAKLPLAGNDKNILSAVSSIDSLEKGGPLKAGMAGLTLDNVKNIGASVSVARTPEFQKTDYSAMGKLNLFRDHSSSLDFTGGASKSVSPFIPTSSWQPALGLSCSKYW